MTNELSLPDLIYFILLGMFHQEDKNGKNLLPYPAFKLVLYEQKR